MHSLTYLLTQSDSVRSERFVRHSLTYLLQTIRQQYVNLQVKPMPEQQINDSFNGKINVIVPSLPKGGGDLTGLGETFSPHEFSGSSGLSIPVPATPCRGFEPKLSINYSSGNGPFDLGTELSLPEISR
jgi:hypothetical protein